MILAAAAILLPVVWMAVESMGPRIPTNASPPDTPPAPETPVK